MSSANEDKYRNKGFDLGGEAPKVSKPTEDLTVKLETPQSSSEEPRATWGKSIEFLMSCIAMNVGLGNIWRFPFVAYDNGGGAFLIPYLLVLFFMGRPMYYLEMCLGQFSSRGNVKMFERLAPVLKGIGYGQLIGTICVATYYCSLMALTLFYIVHSFTNDLPWSECNPEWSSNPILSQSICLPSKYNGSLVNLNSSITSSELWFRLEVLKEAPNIENGIGSPEWRLTLCLFFSWVLTFAVCAKGVKSSGKASYFLAIFPYIILFALLVRAVTLEGSDQGILYFVKPQWNRLSDAKVWYAAVTQCFFSLNIGFGSVTMYASYNDFKHNVYRDAMVVTTLDTLTSFLAGLIIFGILGNLAFKMGVDLRHVIKSGGTGLAFISYPEAIARFEAVPWLFAILFFFMLFVLGVGSLVALQSCAFTVILDSFPKLKTWHVSLATAVGGFFIGLVYVTPGGQYIFTMIDFFGGTFIFYVLNIMEVLSIVWWYGLENICLDIEFMIKRKPGAYFRICWVLIVPIAMLTVFFYFIFTLEELKYEDKPYPYNIIVWGWLLTAFGVTQPLIWFVVEVIKKRQQSQSVKQAILDMFRHNSWGPQEVLRFDKWQLFKTRAKAARISRNRHWIIDKLCIMLGR